MAPSLSSSLGRTPAEAAQHKAQLQNYFDGVGFDRWSAIYGIAPLSRVRRTIREGHERMLAQAAAWLAERFPNPAAQGATLLDAGCGTGLFTVGMAQRGFAVTAIDIAPRMVEATQQATHLAGLDGRVRFHTGDVESLTANQPLRFDAVACFDVLVHYPAPAFTPFCAQLAGLATGVFLFTYAPYSRPLAFLHWLGGRFPQGQRRTEIQMIPDRTVKQALAMAGMHVRRTQKISHGFYHVTLLEAEKDA